MKVSVIGGAGRMGRWLVNFFSTQGHEMVLSDVRRDEARKVAESTGARLAKDNLESVRNVDLVVVSTPIEVTPKVLREISSELKRSTKVMEISSLKSEVVPILEEIAEQGVRTLSVHPLFGPGVQRLAEERVALVPVLNPASEIESAKSLFPDAEVIVVDVEEHDKAMALTLSLPHFLNIAFASVIGEEDLNSLKKLGGTTFTLQSVLAEGVMTEDPGLYASIQMNNDYATPYLDKFLSRAETLKARVAEKDVKGFSEFYMGVHTAISKDRDFFKSYERMYKALKAL